MVEAANFMFYLNHSLKKRPEQVVLCLGGVQLCQEPLGLGSALCRVTSGMVLAVFSLNPSSDVGAGRDDTCSLWWVMGGQEMPSHPLSFHPSQCKRIVLPGRKDNSKSVGFAQIIINYLLICSAFFCQVVV